MKYIIANWKSNKKLNEIIDWFSDFSKLWTSKSILSGLELVLCPPLIYLPICSDLIKKYKFPMVLGAQNISPFDTGAYTGEVTASQVREYAQYVIIGHSERLKYFTDEQKYLQEKVNQATKEGLKPILCIQGLSATVLENVSVVAYEPVGAIGSGNAEAPQEAETVAERIRSNYQIESFIYGGSVTEENAASYFKEKMIDGVLVGGASLNPDKFWTIINEALKQS